MVRYSRDDGGDPTMRPSVEGGRPPPIRPTRGCTILDVRPSSCSPSAATAPSRTRSWPRRRASRPARCTTTSNRSSICTSRSIATCSGASVDASTTRWRVPTRSSASSQAVLEASSAMNGSDPSYAQFTGIGAARHATLSRDRANGWRATWPRPRSSSSISSRSASAPARSTAADRDAAIGFVRLALIGLTDGETTDRRGHRCAIDGVMLLLRGELVHPIAGG